MKEREQTIRNLNEKVDGLHAEIAQLRRQNNTNGGGGGYTRVPGRGCGGRGAGRGAVAAVEFTPPAAKKVKFEDPDYVKDRLSVCLQWNSTKGCERPQGTCIKSQSCNKPAVGNKKECCKGSHKGSEHQ